MTGKGEKELTVSIGQISNSFGVRGEVKVYMLTDYPERFRDLSTVMLSKTGEKPFTLATVQGVKYQKNFAILKLDISTSMEEAKKLKGFFVCIEEQNLHPLPEGDFYIFELKGLSVYSEDELYVGVVEDIQKLPANDLLIVMNGDKEILIPMVKEFISDIDLDKKRITLVPYEGLF